MIPRGAARSCCCQACRLCAGRIRHGRDFEPDRCALLLSGWGRRVLLDGLSPPCRRHRPRQRSTSSLNLRFRAGGSFGRAARGRLVPVRTGLKQALDRARKSVPSGCRCWGATEWISLCFTLDRTAAGMPLGLTRRPFSPSQSLRAEFATRTMIEALPHLPSQFVIVARPPNVASSRGWRTSAGSRTASVCWAAWRRTAFLISYRRGRPPFARFEPRRLPQCPLGKHGLRHAGVARVHRRHHRYVPLVRRDASC